jgi:hypothetical protein
MSLRGPAVRAILESQKLPQSNETPLYLCQNANFGSYLIAANQLRYKDARFAPNGRDVEFIFYDSDQSGELETCLTSC